MSSAKRCAVCEVEVPSDRICACCDAHYPAYRILFGTVTDAIKYEIPKARKTDLLIAHQYEWSLPSPRRTLVRALQRRLQTLETASVEALLVRADASQLTDEDLTMEISRCCSAAVLALSKSAKARFERRRDLMMDEAKQRALKLVEEEA